MPVATCSVVCAPPGEGGRVGKALLDQRPEGGDGGGGHRLWKRDSKLYRINTESKRETEAYITNIV